MLAPCGLLIRGIGQAQDVWCSSGLFCPIPGAQASCRLATSISDSLPTSRRPAAQTSRDGEGAGALNVVGGWLLRRIIGSVRNSREPWLCCRMLLLQVDASHRRVLPEVACCRPSSAKQSITNAPHLAPRVVRQTSLAASALQSCLLQPVCPSGFFDQAPPVLGSGLKPAAHRYLCPWRGMAARPSIAHPSRNAHARTPAPGRMS
jgi:hypothetical protein